MLSTVNSIKTRRVIKSECVKCKFNKIVRVDYLEDCRVHYYCEMCGWERFEE